MRKLIAIIAGTGLVVGTVLAGVYQTGGFTTPPTGTNSIQAVSTNRNLYGHQIVGIIQRIVFTGPNGATNTPATNIVSVVDLDGTLLLSVTLTNTKVIVGTSTNFPGQTLSTNVTLYGYQPSLVVSNATFSNMTDTANFTYQD